ncbi:MAG: phosphohistidine phosphatase SixA [Chromatiales bacterium]|nr:phosphohistidine phosphatase SixA [Chromatiales bacterium]
MKLYLMQHGLAVDKSEDPDRPLSEHGKGDVKLIAAFTQQAGVRVDYLFHSGKTRARQTGEIMAEAIMKQSQPTELLGLNPNDSIEPIIEIVTDLSYETLIVGHLPFLSQLVSSLVVSRVETPLVNFTPGTIACVERDELGNWGVNWIVKPELLTD